MPLKRHIVRFSSPEDAKLGRLSAQDIRHGRASISHCLQRDPKLSTGMFCILIPVSPPLSSSFVCRFFVIVVVIVGVL